MALTKPVSIQADEFKSAKWDEITNGRSFTQAQAPTIELLCQWHAVINRCIQDIDNNGGDVAYQNDIGDLKSMPQIGTMKQASAEIRQLNKQLGILDTVPAQQQAPTSNKGNILQLTIAKRAKKASKAV